MPTPPEMEAAAHAAARAAATAALADPNALINSKQRKMLIPNSDMTIWRWENDPRYTHMGFPKRIMIGGRAYWRASEVRAWLEAQTAAARAA